MPWYYATKREPWKICSGLSSTNFSRSIYTSRVISKGSSNKPLSFYQINEAAHTIPENAIDIIYSKETMLFKPWNNETIEELNKQEVEPNSYKVTCRH